jgi:hypothetical protein
MNVITDDDLRRILKPLAPGVKVSSAANVPAVVSSIRNESSAMKARDVDAPATFDLNCWLPIWIHHKKKQFTMIADCCHSGTLLDHEEVAVGDLYKPHLDCCFGQSDVKGLHLVCSIHSHASPHVPSH